MHLSRPHLNVAARSLIILIGELGLDTGVLLYVDRETLFGQRLHHGGHQGNALLILGDLLGDTDGQLLVGDASDLKKILIYFYFGMNYFKWLELYNV